LNNKNLEGKGFETIFSTPVKRGGKADIDAQWEKGFRQERKGSELWAGREEPMK